MAFLANAFIARLSLALLHSFEVRRSRQPSPEDGQARCGTRPAYSCGAGLRALQRTTASAVLPDARPLPDVTKYDTLLASRRPAGGLGARDGSGGRSNSEVVKQRHVRKATGRGSRTLSASGRPASLRKGANPAGSLPPGVDQPKPRKPCGDGRPQWRPGLKP